MDPLRENLLPRIHADFHGSNSRLVHYFFARLSALSCVSLEKRVHETISRCHAIHISLTPLTLQSRPANSVLFPASSPQYPLHPLPRPRPNPAPPPTALPPYLRRPPPL